MSCTACRKVATPVTAFNFYYGTGDRVSSIRGYGYHNQDLSLIKNTKLGNRMNLQLRIEAFNLWNWHIFQAQGSRRIVEPLKWPARFFGCPCANSTHGNAPFDKAGSTERK